MSSAGDNAAGAASDEVKPYQIRVSSKYLDLTRRKLELTRLPHESAGSESAAWWEPKPIVEPLIDFWVEKYSWRRQEKRLNASVPQFRTSIAVPSAETPVRLHFIHARSAHTNAVPLLLIPPFPFTNLSLIHLVNTFTDPEDASAEQPFHLVIPSLPGLGFSDALPNNTSMISTTAEMLDVLMKRLDYDHYLASNSGPSAKSPSEIDWKLANYLAMYYQGSCLGTHFISPLLAPPKLQESPLEWIKWRLARVLRVPLLGYSHNDFAALQTSSSPGQDDNGAFTPWQSGLDMPRAPEPNTLAYALCDSPVGLLLLVLMLLRVLGPKKQFSDAEIITFTALTWLPGPEATMRFWAHCASTPGADQARSARKPRVGVTVFLGDNEGAEGSQGDCRDMLPKPLADTYSCPAWAKTRYELLASERVSGRPGLLAWERPEVVVGGARSLATAILSVDKRMQASERPGTALLEQVVVEGDAPARAEISGPTGQVAPAGSPNPPLDAPSPKAQSPGDTTEDRQALLQKSVGHSDPGPSQARQRVVATPEPRGAGQGEYVDEAESPDTVIAVAPAKPVGEAEE